MNDNSQARVSTPIVYNHNLMLKEIRDNLKHLRREGDNQVNRTQVVYNGGNVNTNAQNQHVSTNHTRFVQRNNFSEPRGHPEQNLLQVESGYSSSSSECSTQGANDFNGQYGGHIEVCS